MSFSFSLVLLRPPPRPSSTSLLNAAATARVFVFCQDSGGRSKFRPRLHGCIFRSRLQIAARASREVQGGVGGGGQGSYHRSDGMATWK